MKSIFYENYLSQIEQEEQKLNFDSKPIEESFKMATLLKEILEKLKEDVIRQGFVSIDQEKDFFRNIKPTILGKLIYYNKVYRIETLSPASGGKLHIKYFSSVLGDLKQEYKIHISNSEFYRYYRSGRNDQDNILFCLGHINIHNGLNSYVFEIDTKFSTYYDYKVARIIAYELLHSYLLDRISSEDLQIKSLNTASVDDIFWTGTQNELIELIYAFFAAKKISHGQVSIRKISRFFQTVLKFKLTDEHHAFHRMKYREGIRTIFLSKLSNLLEEYMNKDL